MKTIDQLKAERDEIDRQIEALKNKCRADWGDYYYFIGSTGVPLKTEDERLSDDDKRFEIGNYFLTKEEAEHEARHREFEMKVARRFRELNGGVFNLKGSGDYVLYCLEIILEPVSVHPVMSYNIPPHFRGWLGKTKEITQQVIEEFGSENFVKWAKGQL